MQCEIIFGDVIEREVEKLPLRGDCYVAYEVEVYAEFEPATGDDWNEPCTEECARLIGALVTSVKVYDEAGTEWLYGPDFVGPLEPEIVPPGCYLNTTYKESSALEHAAMMQVSSGYDPGDLQ